MAGGLALALIAVLAYALSRRRPGARGPAFGLCDMSPADVADRDGRTIRAWVLCGGRRASEVEALADGLGAANRTAEVAAVLDLWAARRRVETAEPNGELPPAAQREADAAARASDAEARGPAYEPEPLPGIDRPSNAAGLQTVPAEQGAEYNPARARALAGPLSTALRSEVGFSKPSVRAFQRAAGLRPDGVPGCKTINALRHFGINTPPPAYRSASASDIASGIGIVVVDGVSYVRAADCSRPADRYVPPRR